MVAWVAGYAWRERAEQAEAAEERAAKLRGAVLRLHAAAGTEGKLFGSIGTVDIAEACAALGVTVERSEVRLPSGPLRVLGEHQVDLHLHADVNVPITVLIESVDQTE